MNSTRAHAVAVLAVLLLPVVAGCGSEDAVPVDEAGAVGNEAGATGEVHVAEATDADVEALAAGGNEFALDMYGRLAGEGNLFFSPYSISTALAMTATGARGETESEMFETLHFPTEPVDGVETQLPRKRVAGTFARWQEGLAATPETSGYELNVANSLWGQEGYPFKESFLELVDAAFSGGFNLADFERNFEAERVRINEWVEGETRERIKNLIPAGGVNSLTTLVLVNAVYFKGKWASQFDEKRTTDSAFHGEGGDATVPMMSQKTDFRYFENDVVQVLEMPYEGDDVSMLVFLPREDSPMTLAAFEGELSKGLLDELTGSLHEKEVRVYFPRFEMTWGTEDISDHLAALGMESAFTSRADFSGMSDLGDLSIGPVFHKAFVLVNEEGTEAAAATAVVMKRTAMEYETVFRADRPFMFLIRDDASGGILFMGRVVDLG